MHSSILIICLSALALSSEATSAQERTAEEYDRAASLMAASSENNNSGQVITPSRSFPVNSPIDEIIRSGLSKTFKDPESASIKITRGPRLATAITETSRYSGWIVCAQINAKNSYGAYVGYADYMIVIDPGSMNATPLARLTRSFENVDAWRTECYLKHDDDPPALQPATSEQTSPK